LRQIKHSTLEVEGNMSSNNTPNISV